MLLAKAAYALKRRMVVQPKIILYPKGIGLYLAYQKADIFFIILPPVIAKRADLHSCHFAVSVCHKAEILPGSQRSAPVCMTYFYPVINTYRYALFPEPLSRLFYNRNPRSCFIKRYMPQVKLLLIYHKHNVIKAVFYAVFGKVVYSYVLHFVVCYG